MNNQSCSIKVNSLTKIYESQFSELSMLIRKKSMRHNQHVSKSGKVALNNISFSLYPGDRIGIIGENGAGKSTLLSILAGITSATFGRVDIEGKVSAILTLGIGLKEDLTGRENIYIDGELQGKSRKEVNQVIDSIIEFSELQGVIDLPVRTYSTGMKSRLAFSMLLNIEPEILIVDEALSAGDVFFAEKARRAIDEICNKGKIVIIVSHDMNIIERMCNRCFWMEGGKIVQDGEPTVVIASYLEKVYRDDLESNFKASSSDVKSFNLKSELYQIDSFYMSCNRGSTSCEKFYSGSDLTINFSGVTNLSVIKVCMSIQRLDGILIARDNYTIKNQNFSVVIELKPIFLSNGYYNFQLDFLDGKSEIDLSVTKLVEIIMLKRPSGGKAILDYPSQIELISCNKSDVFLC